jgi:hypothetical protein
MSNLTSKYLFIASMDIDPAQEALFNDVYNTEHCPMLDQVPGVGGVTRYETQRLVMAMGGEVREIEIPGTPKHHAVYQLDNPEVLTSSEWAEAVDAGRWPEQVRPYTKNRRHVLLKLTFPEG